MSVSAVPGKTRSPNYPAINLEEAVTRLRRIYDKQRRYPATRDVLVKLMGYGSLNGASATVVSALSKYGLLEGHGDTLRVSELGQDLVLHRAGDPEYTAALHAAAFMPAFFRELRDQYPHGLPSEHSLRASLIKRGFNPKAIDSAIRAYRDTMEFVDAETGGSNTEFPAEPESEVAMQTQHSPTSQGGGSAGGITHLAPPPFVLGATGTLAPPDKVLVYQLTETSEVQAIFRGPVTQEAVQNLVKQLQLQIELNVFPKQTAPAMPPMLTAPATPVLPATIADGEQSEPGE